MIEASGEASGEVSGEGAIFVLRLSYLVTILSYRALSKQYKS